MDMFTYAKKSMEVCRVHLSQSLLLPLKKKGERESNRERDRERNREIKNSENVLSKVVDHIVNMCDVPQARSNYYNASLPPPSPACSLFVLLSVYTVIKNLIIDAAELVRQKAN